MTADGIPLQHYRPQVVSEARALVGVLDGRVREIRLETADASVSIVNPSRARRPVTTEARGAVEGRVETVASHGRLRFTLFESLFGRAVYCYMGPGQ